MKFESSILDYLGVSPAAPNLTLLGTLVTAYTRRVPWESASRIARRAATTETADCPRWAQVFWTDAMRHGTGGTCFESNYAFFHLLESLGYEGYLTINDMGETVGCHTAIIILLDGEKWLVDVGLPLFVPMRLQPDEVMHYSSPFMEYTVRPLGENRYEIGRTPHPNTIAFTLIDNPIPDSDYRAATTNDYGECGLFLDKIIVNKIVNEQLWRFNSDDQPYHLEYFVDNIRNDTPLTGDVAAEVAAHFGIAESVMRAAFVNTTLT